MPNDTFHALLHNPGYDFRRMLVYLKKNDQMKEAPLPPFYSLALGISAGCSAVEGYINSIGERTTEKWVGELVRLERIDSKISRLYDLKDKKVDFGQPPFKAVIDLFEFRKKFAHPRFVSEIHHGKNPPRDIFQECAAHYTLDRVTGIINEFIERILQDFDLDDVWQRRGMNIAELDIERFRSRERTRHIAELESLRSTGKLTEAEFEQAKSNYLNGEEGFGGYAH